MAQSNVPPVSVFLVDDDSCVCELVSQKLRSFKEISFLGSAENTKKAFTEITRLKPQVLLLDMVLRGDFGTNLFKCLKDALGEKAPPAIGFSCFTFESSIQTLLFNGMQGFHAKGDSWADLVQGIHTVNAGGEFFSDAILKMFGKNLPSVTADQILSLKRLTSAEMRILPLLASGLSVKEIAKSLKVSPNTINNHRYNIMRNIGVNSIVGLAHYAIRSGLCNSAEAILPQSFFIGHKAKSPPASS